MPRRSARSASTFGWPSSSCHSAPGARVRRSSSPPVPGMRPSRAQPCLHQPSGPMNLLSQARARSNPMPTAGPSTAATVGTGSSTTARISPWYAEYTRARRSSAGMSARATMPLMSPPAQKAPLPVMTTPRTPGSAAAVSSAAASSPACSGLRAFRLSGQSRMTSAAGPATCVMTPIRLLPEQELADLPAGVPRQFGHEPPVARDLVVRQPLAGPRSHLGGGQRRPRAGDDERHADLAQAFVADPDDRYLGHRRVLTEHCLDLGWVGVEPSDQEHVLLAVGDSQPSLLVKPPDVAGMQPAPDVDNL